MEGRRDKIKYKPDKIYLKCVLSWIIPGRLQKSLRAGNLSNQISPLKLGRDQMAVLLLSSSLCLLIKESWCFLPSVPAVLSCPVRSQVGKSCLHIPEDKNIGAAATQPGQECGMQEPSERLRCCDGGAWACSVLELGQKLAELAA